MKKIVCSVMFFVALLFNIQNIYGADLVKGYGGGVLSFITAPTDSIGQMKQRFYNASNNDITKGYAPLGHEDEGLKYIYNLAYYKSNYDPEAEFRADLRQLPSYYLKYVYRQVIGGKDAFCIDPGKELNHNWQNKQQGLGYYKVYASDANGVSAQKETYFNNLNTTEQMTAVIYNADFSQLKLYLNYNSAGSYNPAPIGEDEQYVIKQLLIWAYMNNKSLFSIFGHTIQLADLDNYESPNPDLFHGYSNKLFMEDIHNGVLHSLQRRDALNTFTYDYEWALIPNNSLFANFKLQIEQILSKSYQDFIIAANRDIDIKICIYEPCGPNGEDVFVDSNGKSKKYVDVYQRMVGIEVPPIPVETITKNYGVIDSYDGSNVLRNDYTAFNDTTANDPAFTIYSKTSPVTYNNEKYVCTGYAIYTSSDGYEGAMKLIEPQYSVPSTSYSGTSYSLDPDTASNYTVIVFKYSKAKQYAVVDYYDGSPHIRTNYTTFTSSVSPSMQLPTSATNRYTYVGYEVRKSNTSINLNTISKGTASSSATSLTLSPSSSSPYNVVVFYYEVIPVVNVYVRHYTKNSEGTYSLNNGLANSKAVYLKSGTSAYVTLASKGSSTSYSEYYKIEKGDKLLVDRSRTLMSGGVYYNCVGFKLNDTGGVISNQSLQQTIYANNLTNKTTNYYINYYYNPYDYSKDVTSIGNSARLRFVTKSSSDYSSLGTNNSVVRSTIAGASENASVAYAPITENLKPYVVSDICRARTAKYDVSISGNNLVYSVTSYTAWGVSDSTNMANVASVVGVGATQVYNSTPYMNINGDSVRGTIAGTINTIKNISSVFTGTAANANTTFKNMLSTIASSKTTEAYYYNNGAYNVPTDKYNGERQPTGNISYKIYTVGTSGITSKTGDTNYNISAANSMKVNIYTPAQVGDIEIKSIDFVNHSNHTGSAVIQQGVTFNVTVSTKKDTSYPVNIYNQIKNTGKYVKYWYLMFDFDVTYNGVTYTANSPIKVNAGTDAYATTTISNLQAVTNSTDKEVVQSTLNNIKAIAATENLPSDDYANEKIGMITADKSDSTNSNIRIDNSNIKMSTTADLGLSNSSYYLVSSIQNTVSIGRVFDFEITDCLDVNFKDVFRYLNTEDNTVNALTGTRYFSGIRRLLATDSITTNNTNILVDRSNLVVGNVTKILPLGPYKHTTNTYIQSVKLGYRFSFDLKTSGYYSPKTNSKVERSVRITPSYYYISKDGKTFNDNIKIYYKNSSGKYTNFETSNYTIYYKPDDGYRNLYNSSTYSETDVSKVSKDGVTTLTNSLVGLNIGSTSGFTLSSKKSMTSSDGGYLQAWYGEFKVPNSAIALAVDASGNVDINSPLTDGYIGVKFKIECIDKYENRTDDVVISYDSNDTGLGNSAVNTSQWDYEGFLGFKKSNIGSKLNGTLNIQLENGVWNINDDMYNKIKGTVILYDLDNKASNDYN